MKQLRFGHFEIRPDERQLLVKGAPTSLGSRAFDLLLTLVEQRDRVVTKAELLDRVWPGLVVEEGNLPTQVSTLRKLLGPDAIATLPGRGYRFTLAPADSVPPEQPASVTEATPRAAALPAAPVLFGRGSDLQELLDELRVRRFVTVIGAGGIGKTALALGAVNSLRDAHRDGAAWVDLAPVADANLLPSAIGRALQLSVAGRDPVAALVAGLHAKQLLLVLDNAEHLVEPLRTLLPALLSGAPDLRLLVTSQVALRLQDEQLFRLGSLAVPPPDALPEAAAAHGAVALFSAQARALDRGFSLTDGNVRTVIEICRRLDGVALALKLAAARVPLLGLSGLQARLNERFRLLASGPHDAPNRHQTLRAAMDWSYGLLPAAEQAVFRQLSVLVGSFPLDLAAKCAADAEHDEWSAVELLGNLVDRSFVVVEPGDAPRYRLLESARDYGVLQLGALGQRAAAHLRVAEVLQRSFGELVEREPEVLAWHLGEGGSLELAVPLWAKAAGQAAARSALVEAAHHLVKATGLLRKLADDKPAQASEFRRAELPLRLKLGSLNMFTRGIGCAEAQHDFERALELANERGQISDQFMATFNLWFNAEAQIRFDLTERYIAKARQLAEASGDDRFKVQANHAGWTTSMVLGRFDELCRQAEEGYRRYRPADALFHCEHFAGHDPGICALAHLSCGQHFLGNVDAGIDYSRRTLAAMQDLANGPSRAVGAYGLTLIWVMLRDPVSARPVANEALEACKRLSLTQYMGLFTTITSWVDASNRQNADSGRLAVDGAEKFGSTGSRLRQPMIRAIAAEACLFSGDLALAARTIDSALKGIADQGEHGWLPYALSVRAEIQRAIGEASRCEQDLLQAIDVSRGQGALAMELRAANGLARSWMATGGLQRAQALLQPLVARFTCRGETADLAAARAILAMPQG